MPKNIDYDRGVVKRKHPSGLELYMYMDEPGTYRNAFGNEVEETLAKEAGFKVDSLRLAKLKKERMAEAMSQIEAELADEKREVVKEKDGFKVVSIGLGRHIVEGPDGTSLTDTPIPKEMAETILERLVKPQEKKKEPAEKAPESKDTPKK